MKINYSLVFFLCMIITFPLSSQERFTEDEIKAEDNYLAAQVEAFKGRNDKAIQLYLGIFKKDKTNGVVAYELAKSYEAIEDYPNADKYASIAIRLLPDNIWVLLFYGKLMTKMEKYEDGAKAFYLLDIKDHDDRSHIENYAKCLISARKENEAIKKLNEWEVSNGIHEPLIKLKYDIYKEQGNQKKAENELNKLLSSAPHNTRYLNNLATFYSQANEKKKAKVIYEKILSLDPNDTKANTAIMLMADGDKKDAPYLRTLLPLIEKQDLDPDIKIKELIPFVTQLYDGENNELKASLLKLTESLVLIHPNNAKCHAIRSDVLNLTGDRIQAIESYEKTLTLDDTVYEVWKQLLYLVYEENDYARLEKISYDAMDLFPNQPENYLFSGIAYNEKNNVDEAIDVLSEGLLIAGKNISHQSNINAELGRSYFINGQTAKAHELITESLRLSQNNNPIALEVKGDLLGAEGKTDEAIIYWKKAIEKGSKRNSLTKKLSQ